MKSILLQKTCATVQTSMRFYKNFFSFFWHNKQDCNSSYFCTFYVEDLQKQIVQYARIITRMVVIVMLKFIFFFRQINVIYAIETFLR